ncbi:MAG: hypothetical protein A3A30_02815 [Candidatus Terrybacteria bacterium RIFCSPLOWO2_01_FULL_48_14]|nr:MAG: hypothetical protein A3A30_02815 [Candidatus Terrybacteria bacterium RIFCSPLOWO2_01_FULL_48_14]
MQVKVPKFIDIEDKVIFGLTWRQFLFLGVGGGVGIVAFYVLVQPLGTAIGVVSMTIGAIFALVKINNRPMHIFVYSLWNYFFNPRQYTWKKEATAARTAKVTKITKKETPATPKTITPERLKRLSVLLDIQGQAHQKGIGDKR